MQLKEIKDKRNLLEVTLELVGIIIILFTSFSPIFKTYNYGSWMILALFFIFGINIFIFKKKISTDNSLIFGISFILIIILLQDFIRIMRYESKDISGLWYLIRLICTGLYITTINKNRVLYILEKIVIYINYFGLICYVLVNYFSSNLYLSKLALNTGNYSTILGIYGFYTNRAYQYSSFTWEPSINSILLGSILMFKLFKKTKMKLELEEFFLMMGIYLSKSTTGYLILLLVIIKIISISNRKSKFKLIVLLIGFLIFISPMISRKIFSKITTVNIQKRVYGQSSTAARKMHFLIDLEIFKDNIILGKTFDKDFERKKRRDYARKLAKNYKYFKYFINKNIEYGISSNAITFTLARRGVLVLLILYFLHFKNIIRSLNLNKLIYFIFFNLAFITQEVLWLPYFIMLIFMNKVILNREKKGVKSGKKNYNNYSNL